MTKTKQIFQFSLFALLSCFMLVGDAKAQGAGAGQPILIYTGITSADGMDLMTLAQEIAFFQTVRDYLADPSLPIPSVCVYGDLNGPGASQAQEDAWLKAYEEAQKTIIRLKAEGYYVGNIIRYDCWVDCNGKWWRHPKNRNLFITYTAYCTYEIWGYPPSGIGNVGKATSPGW